MDGASRIDGEERRIRCCVLRFDFLRVDSGVGNGRGRFGVRHEKDSERRVDTGLSARLEKGEANQSAGARRTQVPNGVLGDVAILGILSDSTDGGHALLVRSDSEHSPYCAAPVYSVQHGVPHDT